MARSALVGFHRPSIACCTTFSLIRGLASAWDTPIMGQASFTHPEGRSWSISAGTVRVVTSETDSLPVAGCRPQVPGLIPLRASTLPVMRIPAAGRRSSTPRRRGLGNCQCFALLPVNCPRSAQHPSNPSNSHSPGAGQRAAPTSNRPRNSLPPSNYATPIPQIPWIDPFQGFVLPIVTRISSPFRPVRSRKPR
jgi:hypothetical protein